MPKHTVPALSAVAALAFLLCAAPAYAQDAMADKASDKEAVMEAAEETLKSAEDMMDAAEALNAPDTTAEPVMSDDAMINGDATMHDGKVMAKGDMTTSDMTAMQKPDTAPMQAPATTPLACPSGTTAQADGTCMVTGDWDG